MKVLFVYELKVSSDRLDPLWVIEARRALIDDGAVQMYVHHVVSRRECRRALYKYFGGRQIMIRYGYNREGNLRAEVHIGARIRTSAQAQGELVERKICPVCMRTLPLDRFPYRISTAAAEEMLGLGQEPPHYSYCRECHNAYTRWRHFFLKTHQVDRLTPQFSDRVSPNKAFMEYLEALTQTK